MARRRAGRPGGRPGGHRVVGASGLARGLLPLLLAPAVGAGSDEELEALLASGGGQDAAAPDRCKDAASSVEIGCSFDDVAACYSLQPGVRWACWPKGNTPRWMSDKSTADAACRAWPLMAPTTGGNAAGPIAYDGACLFGEEQPPARRPALLPWDDAYAMASSSLFLLSDSEKRGLLSGTGWNDPPEWYTRKKGYYVGNTEPVSEFGIPGLHLMDASAGFSLYWHELVGTVTAWPSMLALAATWNPELTRIYAMALGNEFAGKGANGILGPQLNVIRPARGGRNMESLSGEDPYLGARLAEKYVEGVQSQGVLATMKHFIFNEQENERESYSVEVDDKTAWELYYPPFEAAVNAGVCAAMCSYNKVNDVHACENKKELTQVLKGTMGFRGYVQSDWWATHSASLSEGLDQEMPGNVGNPDHLKPYFGKAALQNQSHTVVDEAAKRVLAAIFRMNLTTPCVPPNCSEWFKRNVTSPAHSGLARAVAAESIVLLQNDDALPIEADRVRTIAVVGAAASAEPYDPSEPGQQHGDWATGDYYTAGGSGHVTAGQFVTPLQGISSRAQELGIQVLASASSNMTSAVEVAKEADVAVVVAGTTAGESRDREGLTLDDDMDAVIEEVAKNARATVVLLMLPGAALMKWRNSVSAIMVMFLGGQEAGAAWADVLFGDRGPEGRLPITMPASEQDTIPPASGTIVYSEGVSTGYRNSKAGYAYAFGHGLSYTHFDFLPPAQVECPRELSEGSLVLGDYTPVVCLDAAVRNAGQRPGKTVAQLYLELSSPPVPGEAKGDTPVLKGFRKTAVLLPSSNETVHFQLTRRDLSYYDSEMGTWVAASAATAHIGASSADIRQVRQLMLPRVRAPTAKGGFDKQWWNDLLGMAALLGLLGGAACCHAAQSRSEGRLRNGGMGGAGVAWLHCDSDA